MNIISENSKKSRRTVKHEFVVLSAISVFIALVMFAVPNIIVGMTPGVKITFPSFGTVSRDIYVDGVVEQEAKKDIIVEFPIVPDEIMIEVGDTVKKDDVLATIDKAATQAAVFSMVSATNLIPAEYVDAISNLNINIPDNLITSKIPDEIKATADGVITTMSLVSGAISTPKTAVCTISKVDEIRLNMNVGELDANAVKEGDVVTFEAEATAGEQYLGTVTKVFPVATKVLSGTTQKTVVGIYVKPDISYESLKPGYSVSGVVQKKADQAKMMLSYELIGQDENNNEFVYCYKNSKAIKKYIKTGEEFANGVIIEDGLDKNDAIISNPTLVKGDDCFVRIVN